MSPLGSCTACGKADSRLSIRPVPSTSIDGNVPARSGLWLSRICRSQFGQATITEVVGQTHNGEANGESMVGLFTIDPSTWALLECRKSSLVV